MVSGVRGDCQPRTRQISVMNVGQALLGEGILGAGSWGLCQRLRGLGSGSSSPDPVSFLACQNPYSCGVRSVSGTNVLMGCTNRGEGSDVPGGVSTDA